MFGDDNIFSSGSVEVLSCTTDSDGEGYLSIFFCNAEMATSFFFVTCFGDNDQIRDQKLISDNPKNKNEVKKRNQSNDKLRKSTFKKLLQGT